MLPSASRLLLVSATVSVIAFAARTPALEVDDSAFYLGPARSWAAGAGLREEGRPLESRLPLYPLALGLLDRFAGASPSTVARFNMACHISAVLLVWSVLRRRMEASDADAIAAAAMVYPPLVTAASLVLQESFLSLLLALVFVTMWHAAERGGVAWSAAAGAALGLSGLAKVTALPLVAPAAVLVALAGRTRSATVAGRARPARPPLVSSAALVLGAVVVLLPWAVRNQVVLGRFEVTNANGGHTFLGGTVSNRVADWAKLPEYVAACRAWEQRDRLAHPVLDRYLYGVALRRIAAAPGRWLILVAERLVRFLLPARHWAVAVGLAHAGTFPPWYVLATLINVLLFGAAGWTAWTAVSKRDLPLLVGPLIVFGHQLVYALTYVSPRYAVTVGPVLFGAAGLAAARPAASGSVGRGVTSSARRPEGFPP